MSVTRFLSDDPTIANRYLADQLTDEERVLFEKRLAEDPQALRELEATARMKVALESLRDTGRLDDLIAGSPRPVVKRFRLHAAVAAALILAIAIGFFRWEGASTPMIAASIATLVDDKGNPLSIASTHALFRKRGSAFDAVIQLPATRQAIELRVLPDSAEPGARYNASLQSTDDRGTSEGTSSLGALQAGSDGAISIYMDSARIPPGNYELVLAGEARSELLAADTFLIQIRPSL